QNQITLVYPSSSNQTVRLNVYAFSGKEAYTQTTSAQQGSNQVQFSVQSFAPGVYYFIIHGQESGMVEAKGKFLVTP
ncbi:MAG TPA: T9SS type A sorting domain-containing protein, partial [bacterium]|nr:T9SS type A sorting domain-containing protein [bacterium]